jgi:Uncharacterized protein conserved in bacteria (DUF2344)
VDPPTESPDQVVLEPRQRWRLTVARVADAPVLAQRELADAWSAAIEASVLPVASGGRRSRSAVMFGAALAVTMPAEAELMELLLTERWPRWRVREVLEPVLPTGWSLVDLADVWLGAPSLPAAIAGADYRITLADAVDPNLLRLAAESLLAAGELRRPKPKGDADAMYDLRPLLVDVVVARPGPPVVLRVRTRIHQTLGSGRPEEVVAALGEQLGQTLAVAGTVRERVLVADELDAAEAWAAI